MGSAAFDADTAGHTALLGWLGGHRSVERVGVEGTGSYGAGLARHLTAAGVDVVDVNRPNRQMRRRRGKTDTVDAEPAARAALNGSAAVVLKSADGCVEAIRTLRVARRCAVKARTVAANQIDAVVVTAPEPVKDRLRALNTARTVAACARMRPGTHGDLVRAAAKRALRCLARRHQALTAQIKHLDAELRRLCERANPALLGACGIGAETAAALLVAAGDNPERLRSEASFAALCGTSPIEASSGPTVRHRLNRGGNRQANNALWRIAMVRLRVDERSIAYAARLTAGGQDPTRDTPLPQTPHRTRGLQADHRPARRRPRSGPAPPPHPTRAHHPPHSPSPRSRTQPDIRTRKRHHPQPRPRRTLPATPRTDRELTNIGASTDGVRHRSPPLGHCGACTVKVSSRCPVLLSNTANELGAPIPTMIRSPSTHRSRLKNEWNPHEVHTLLDASAREAGGPGDTV